MTEFIQVYRAVTLVKLDDLKHLGRFRNPYGNEVKYFALTRKGAAKYAGYAAAVFGEGPLAGIGQLSKPLCRMAALCNR